MVLVLVRSVKFQIQWISVSRVTHYAYWAKTEILVYVIDVETSVKGTKRKLATKATPPSSNKKQKPNARELLHVPLNVKVIGSDSWEKAVITEVEGDLVDFHYESGNTRCGVRLTGDTASPCFDPSAHGFLKHFTRVSSLCPCRNLALDPCSACASLRQLAERSLHLTACSVRREV